MIAVDTSRSELSGSNVDVGCTNSRAVTNKQPENAAMPPEIANADSFMRVADTVDAAAISSLSRTAIIERPMPVRRSRAVIIAIRNRQARHR